MKLLIFLKIRIRKNNKRFRAQVRNLWSLSFYWYSVLSLLFSFSLLSVQASCNLIRASKHKPKHEIQRKKQL